MCALTEAVHDVQHAAQRLSQACIDKTPLTLREFYNRAAEEELPDDLKELLAKLK